MPELGQKSREYPLGYGICQCGCGKKARRLPDGTFARYYNLYHHPVYKSHHQRQPQLPMVRLPRKRPAYVENVVADRIAMKYYDLTKRAWRLEKRVKSLQLEMQFAASFIRRNWSGDALAKQVLLRRIEALLHNNARADKTSHGGLPGAAISNSLNTEGLPSAD